MATKKTEAAENPALDLAEVQKQIMAMIADAKAEAEKIVAEAKEAAAEINAPAKSKAEEEAERAAFEAYMNEPVEIKLFRDNNKYKDDVYVSVNGDNVVIKRGERVQVKRKFVQVLEQSEREKNALADLIEAKSRQFERDVAAGRL